MEALLKNYIKRNLSPSIEERTFISDKYNQIASFFSDGQVFQSGSYARFTSISPVNDLDIVWTLPEDFIRLNKSISVEDINPERVIHDLASFLEKEYKAAGEEVNVIPQTHSIGVYFGNKDDFSIDIVPAIPLAEKNEFGDCLYSVPELLKLSRSLRKKLYSSGEKISWKKSDPKGYARVSSIVNDSNDSFRKVVKFIKSWRRSCKKNYPLLSLKSFHLEIIIYQVFLNNPDIGVVPAVRKFFEILPSYLNKPIINDRADNSVFIDEYLNGVSDFDKREIKYLCELALRHLNSITDDRDIKLLISALDDGEEVIQDQGLVFDDDLGGINISAEVLPGKGSFRPYTLDSTGNLIGRKRKIKFSVSISDLMDDYPEGYLKWKVKNRISDYLLEKPRGEITDHHTLRDPESTEYVGQHYVDCYLIDKDKCVGFSRQYVVIQ